MRTARAASILAVGFLLGTLFVGVAAAGCNSLVNQPTVCAVAIYEYQKKQAQQKVAGLGSGTDGASGAVDDALAGGAPSTDGLTGQAGDAAQTVQDAVASGPSGVQDTANGARDAALQQAADAEAAALGPLGEAGQSASDAVDGARDSAIAASGPDVVWASDIPGLVVECTPTVTPPSGGDSNPLKDGVTTYASGQQEAAQNFVSAEPNSDYAGAAGFVNSTYGGAAGVVTQWYDWVFYPLVAVPLTNTITDLSTLPDLAEKAQETQALVQGLQASTGATMTCALAIQLVPPLPSL